MSRFVPEIVDKEVQLEAPKLRSIDGDAFTTLLPLQSRGDFSDTEVRDTQGELEVGPGGENLVAEPGSLTVTGRTGIDGAEVRGEAVEAGAQVCGVDELGYPGIEVGEPLQAALSYSGVERQWNVIIDDQCGARALPEIPRGKVTKLKTKHVGSGDIPQGMCRCLK